MTQGQDTIVGIYLIAKEKPSILQSILPKGIYFDLSKNWNINCISKLINGTKQIYGNQVAVTLVQIMQKISIDFLAKQGIMVSYNQCLGTKKIGCLYDMINSGSKRLVMNLIQIQNNLGYQFVLGKEMDIDKLPYLRKGDNMINSSYIKGLNPEEFFVHQMAAWEGIINTGVNTSTTGYLSRRVCKIMGNI